MNNYLNEYVNLIGGKKKNSRKLNSKVEGRKLNSKVVKRNLKRETNIRERYLESYDDYINNILPRALQINNKQWLIDIFNNKKTNDIVLHQDENFVLINDMKWNGKNIYELRILAFFKDPELYCIRSLTSKHIELLENVKNISCKIIKKIFNVDELQLKLFFHYRPTIWQLHLHFHSLYLKSPASSIERAHSYYSTIENLKLDNDYFKKVKLHCYNDIHGEIQG